MSLHDDEVAVDADLVTALLVEQMPHLAHLRPVEVDTAGSVNAVHRIGEHLCTRLPRAQRFVPDLEREARWLAHLAPHLPLAVPEVVATGRPGRGYPYPWALYRWVDGVLYDRTLIADQERAGGDLAGFVAALRAQPLVTDALPAGRAPLANLAEETRDALNRCAPEFGRRGVDAALAAWEQALDAPVWDGRAVWVHADLLPFNLTVVDGALHGVIDFGAIGVGDPVADVIAAWTLGQERASRRIWALSARVSRRRRGERPGSAPRAPTRCRTPGGACRATRPRPWPPGTVGSAPALLDPSSRGRLCRAVRES